MISGSWVNDPETGVIQIKCLKIQGISIIGMIFMRLTPTGSSLFHKVQQYSQLVDTDATQLRGTNLNGRCSAQSGKICKNLKGFQTQGWKDVDG